MNETDELLPVADLSEEEQRRQARTLLASIFGIAACGLVYELLIATVSAYHLGNSVTQFSLAIGLFIGAMGVGSSLSQRVKTKLLPTFISIEIGLGLLGGASVALLYFAYGFGEVLYWIVLIFVLVGIGTLTGLELPLLTRMLRSYGTLRTVIAQALAFDYIGALLGSVLFPLVLLPTLGLMRTACLVGLMNVAVAVWNVRVFQNLQRGLQKLTVTAVIVGGVLLAGFIGSLQLISILESRVYDDEIVYAEQTPYQKIVVTRWRNDLRLFLDGNLQFSATDEYRYHESLIHPAMSIPPVIENVLILGGGDGLGIREVLKYPELKSITLIDLDERMTRLGRTYPAIVNLNQHAFDDPRVRVIHQDAFEFLRHDDRIYEIIIGDLPDPNNDLLAKLYTTQMYGLVKKRLAATGAFVTQATSPLASRDAFWCIEASMKSAGFVTSPYHVYVPTFGDWGFILARPTAIEIPKLDVKVPTRFLTREALPGLFTFGKDSERVPIEVSTLDRPIVLRYYLESWRKPGP